MSPSIQPPELTDAHSPASARRNQVKEQGNYTPAEQKPRHRRVSEETTERGNEFRKWGKCWWMVYAGQALPVPEIRGLELIHHLMRHPGQAVACRVLAAVNCDAPAVMRGCQRERTDLSRHPENQPEGMDFAPTDLAEQAQECGQPVLDPKALNEIRQSMEELGEEIKAFAELGERDRVEELEAKREFCEKELARSIYRGRSREFDTSGAKNRKAVQKSIRAAIKSLESDHPKLARHLADSISTGWQCGYYPAEAMDWELGEPKMLPAKAQCHR